MPIDSDSTVPADTVDAIESLTPEELVDRYDTILIDAYGVLVDSFGPVTGAHRLLDAVAATGREFFVVTNDASRLPETAARRFADAGLAIEAGQVITSGSLIAGHFAANDLHGARSAVLGPSDSEAYVRAAGGRVVPVRADGEYDAVIVCDEAGYPFLETVDEIMSALYRHFDLDREVALILPNPDLVYPKQGGRYGFTSGGAVLLLEAALARRFPERASEFVRLGKPHRPIFDEARRRASSDRMVMLGDQLETDIAGARAAGIDSALVTTGISRENAARGELRPTFLLTI